MTKVIWLGEDQGDIPGPSFTTCYGGLKFSKGEPVELTDPDMIRRAKGNPNFNVIEGKQKEESHGESQTQKEQGKEQSEVKEQSKDYRETEKGTGYSPVKKKVRKRKERTADSGAAV